MIEEELFHRVLEKPTLAEQLGYLDEVCSDQPELRERVERLLRSHRLEDSFLHAGMTLEQTICERPGTQIGPYKLLQQIGEGGFGIVFMAEQVDPVRRRVALKVIKPGMDTRQVIARFEAERQALAVMDHPHVARVLDAGATEYGRPYFVMELVRGTPITQYCDENNLPVRERLELFASVCQAIQHAHTKGIIHRDIKPTNVLVTRQDGQPVVKVIDFGIAKATGQQLTEKTLFTDFAQMIGTPLYMSPEQAELSSNDIDTRSDIYSLGVLLYELLTGSTPVSKEQLQQAAFDEIRRIIREDEPQKPSTRISTAQAAPSIAAQRHTEPAKLTKLVRGELDWIVMKALEKDRGRRYETANGFAMDVQRYLNDEPVRACPPSVGYRFRKFARRNKAALFMGSLITLALLTGTVVSAWQAIRAESSRREAERQRVLADTSYQQARQVVDKLFVHIGDDVTLNQPEFQPLRAELLQSALRYHQQFIDTWKEEPAKRAALADSYRYVAYLTQQMGAQPEALSAYQKSLDLQQQLTGERGKDNRRIEDLASTWVAFGHSQQSTGRYTEAARSFDQGIALWRALVQQHPAEPRYQNGLAYALTNFSYFLREQGKIDESLRHLRQAAFLREQLTASDPDSVPFQLGLATTYGNLGNCLFEARQLDEALAVQNKRLALLQNLVKQHGARRSFELSIAQAFNNIGDIHRVNRGQAGWAEKALASYAEAATVQERLLREQPTSAVVQSNLANTLINTGQVYRRQKNDAKAVATLDHAIDLLERIVGVNPESVNDLSSLGTTHCEKARALASLRRPNEAAESFQKGVACYENLVLLAPTHARYRRELAGFRQELERVQKKD
jgi:serine/threonine protein kinase